MQVKFSFVFGLSVMFKCFNIVFQSGKESIYSSGLLNEVTIGQQLINAMITIQTEVDFIGCLESCVRRRRCRSVNYFERFKICELNYKPRQNENVKMVNVSSVVYSYRSQWDEKKLNTDVCRRNPCTKDKQCHERANGVADCIISDCGLPRKQYRSSYRTDYVFGLYSKITYKCRDGYYMKGKSSIGCQANGRWSPFRFQCLSVCEKDWEYFKKSYYMLSENNSTWTNAKVQCEAQGAFLVEITSNQENEFIHSQANGLKRVWIGGTDNGEEGVWKWVNSGRVFSEQIKATYNNWNSGEPNGGVAENYTAMQGSNGKWVDISSNEDTYFYICEKHTLVPDV